jgi:peptidoglycan/xylan/chitin deacetylase (PgdA/CDA1 family)
MKSRLLPFHFWCASLIISTGFTALVSGSVFFTSIVLLIHAAIFFNGIFNIRAGFFCRVLYKGSRKSSCVALTFDDGPDPDLTPEVLDILKKHNIKAAFFVIANRAACHPEIIIRACNEGHIIACHDLSHNILSNFRMGKSLLRNLNEACGIIEKIIGRKPHLYRPPSGFTNPHYAFALKKENLQCIGWNKRALDCGNRNKKGILRISGLSSSGDVILLHDRLPIPEYKGIILEQIDRLCINIRKHDLKAVTIDNLLKTKAYQT